MADTQILSELARQREGMPLSRDRLMTTVFLVGALHALVILGVTFTAAGGLGSHESPTLAVLLVRDPVAEERVNTAADYLAQVNQRGAGTDEKARSAESPHTPPSDPGTEGAEDSSGSQGTTAGREGDQDRLFGSAPGDKRYFAHGGPAAPAGAPLVMQPLTPEFAGIDTGDALRLRGHAERELLVAANTRESSVAVYLDAWRRKIERVGTANYPLEAAQRAGLSGSPVLEVQILASGELGQAFVKRSSGFAELDQAALAILKLAAPFEPFPAALASQHDALRLTYEWQFLGGTPQGSTVSVPADTR